MVLVAWTDVFCGYEYDAGTFAVESDVVDVWKTYGIVTLLVVNDVDEISNENKDPSLRLRRTAD